MPVSPVSASIYRVSAWWWLPALLLLVVGVGWLLLSRPVGSVVIEGVLSPAEEQAVREVLAPHIEQPLLRVDLQALVADIVSLSWPQAVTVRRHWPERLVVNIAKQQVVAAWQDGQYLTSNGNVVTLETVQANLPALRTSRTEPMQALEIFQRLRAITDSHNQQLLALVENSLGEWQLTLNDSMSVMLGQAETVAELLIRLNRVYVVRNNLSDVDRSNLVYADARYTQGVAVRMRDTQAQSTLIATSE